ncbi:cysteine--1-D-myo-inosityl 2-amino-2-deoxy-alpha-D-glucopyranoside ligase [Ornithinimicrobium cryptoxanthini]|uniref:L-cysteine:1D-myo-inositol 2-amino-2-deoxy-alpha-D-glucopyranoside ligase n=1 Tax=Ornithinimicrobium cryptoxanthini TaxID=2934161 RepID=A0ABY4YDW0_9MICO|nr:cysteine--1-D-myo-inosityl 2-amino-2-deoxy-alpha-D-glucopyranoside ligase [Ornithinimicrobium cryptoxanthini]USQ74834.1 cysteine--1-D-myo-inosityl 2-amino-2-deoxy-alpha-D-glucopyranoside ligase [Ornithinimicrobium cryptoxanthini]
MKTWTTAPVPDAPGQGGPLTVHDTATGLAQVVHPASGRAGLYVCGITPYDATHMGHAATYVTFDLVVRVWRDAGLDVTYVQNVTDVDEPLLERAERDGLAWQDLAADQIALFHEDMEALNVIAPQHYVGAVEGIPDDVTAVRQLLADGTAYALPVDEAAGGDAGTDAVGHDYYLDLATQPTFPEVSGWSRDQMMEVFGERGGDPDRPGKRDRLDPLLWRGHRAGEPHWDGDDLGPGRPGWHIECTTIALRYLGPTFVMQGGGTDLIFPHHEMSAVQARALTGERFASVYVHQAMVGLDGEKMSKSKGNLVLVSALRRGGVDPMAIRLALLSKHYGTPWDWTDEILQTAVERLANWRSAVSAAATGMEAQESPVVAEIRTALAADLDSPAALLAVDEWVRVGAPGDRAALAAAVDALLGVRL